MNGITISKGTGVGLILLGILSCGGGGGSGDVIVLNPVEEPTEFYKGLDTADIDNDGLVDIVAVNSLNDGNNNTEFSLKVFRQSQIETSGFGSGSRIVYSQFREQSKLILSDLRRSGLPDAVTQGYSIGGFLVFENDAENIGGFKAPLHYGPMDQLPTDTICILGAIAVGDLNGDLYPDVAVADGDVIKYYPQDATNPATFLGGITIGSGACSIAIGDVNGDELNDLVTFDPDREELELENPSDSRLFYYRQATGSPGQFLAPVSISLPLLTASAVAISDLNNDGLADIVAYGGSEDGAQINIQLQISLDAFIQGQSLKLQGDGLGGTLEIADLDQDDDFEIIAGLRTSALDPNTIEIFERDVAGTYRSVALLVIPDEQAFSNPEFFSLKAADLNNDSQLDIVASTYEIIVYFSRPGEPGKFDDATIIASQR